MGGIHIRVVYPQKCGVFAATSVCFSRVMEGRSIATWEQERHAPVRVRGAEDGGGPAGPSTVKGKRLLLRSLVKNGPFYPVFTPG